MMIVGIGTDIIEIQRIGKAIQQVGFLEKVFAEKEIQYFKDNGERVESVAGYFAAKEAIVKAFGVGFSKFPANEIVIVKDELGKPYPVFMGKALEFVNTSKIRKVHLSISHDRDKAIAFAVAEGEV